MLFCFASCIAADEGFKIYDLKVPGQTQQVHYQLYYPQMFKDKNLPVLICVGGLPIIDGKYVHSDTKECFGPAWKQMADERGLAILGVGFLFDEEDWKHKKSYQYPRAWSGRAVLDILQKLSQEHRINIDELFLYGVSAGSQFSMRFAFMNPLKVKGVTAHAAGGYDPPLGKIPTKFLMTVGENDNVKFVRKDMAVEFSQAASLFDIDHQLEIIPDIAHIQTEKQNEMSREFIQDVLDSENIKEDLSFDIPSVAMGIREEDLFTTFPRDQARTRRVQGSDEWITYLYGPQQKDFITFYIKEGQVFNWGLNARSEIVDEYLSEFASGGLMRSYPNISKALVNAMNHLPEEAFFKVTDRKKPLVFLDVITSGIARYANATQMRLRADDPPAFQDGFYVIKLGDELNNGDAKAIEGVILHEIIHDYLDHLNGAPVTCDTERQTNRLLKEWGFEENWQMASDQFGAKNKSDSPCFDE